MGSAGAPDSAYSRVAAGLLDRFRYTSAAWVMVGGVAVTDRPREGAEVAWLPVPESAERVLARMREVPLTERLGPVDGVMVKTLRKSADPRGYFIEQLKRGDLDDQGRPFIPEQLFAQTSRSLAYARGGNPPELIKAFHWHREQWDYWDILQGDARVVLVDLREGSATEGRVQTLVLGENAPRMVAIPPMVAHGYQALALRDVILSYYVTEPYDADNPDEGRIPWNDPRIAFDWAVENS